MKDPEGTAQLPLPAVPGKATADIIRLPLADRARASRAVAKPAQQRAGLWYALYFPQLAELAEARQHRLLRELAGLVKDVSSSVSFHPQALVCEVRSSLKYFGGIDAIHQRLQESVTRRLQQLQLPHHFHHAAAPTVTGCLLLARSGQRLLVYRKDNLRSALGQLPTQVLQLDKEQSRRLYNMGVRHLRDIWRLPTDGLRRRFGSEFVNLLNKALGKAPEPTRNYLPPPAFATSYDLPFEIESLDRLLPVADEMLAQLCEFLQRRDLSTSQLVFSLLHEKREGTAVRLGLRQPSRCREHLLLLLETHFASLAIPAPVTALKIQVEKFDAFMGHSGPLLEADRAGDRGHGNGNLDQFMEQLQARLGENYIRNISSVAEHCPEYACRELCYEEADNRQRSAAGPPATVNPRPLWLLEQPLQLNVRRGRLYHHGPVAIISGPERIETAWWTGADVQRDYYVACEQGGSRLWIYHDRQGEKHWYLHGVFA